MAKSARFGFIIILALAMLVGTACTGKTSTSTPVSSSTTAMSMTTTTSMPMTSQPMTTSTVVNSLLPTGSTITITGYITTEDDFAAKLGADTSGMINMKMMAMSGLGITRQMANGSWEFYYFNGGISSGGMVNGSWAFNGTAAQMDAWNIVLAVAAGTPMASVPVTVTGALNGDTVTNPGMDADGLYFPVITVSSIVKN